MTGQVQDVTIKRSGSATMGTIGEVASVDISIVSSGNRNVNAFALPKISTAESELSNQSLSSTADLVYPDYENEQNENDHVPSTLCCLEGCVICTLASILFIIVVPAGITLTLYANNVSSGTFLAIGITLIAIPFLSVPIFIAIVLNRRRLRDIEREKRTSQVKYQS